MGLGPEFWRGLGEALMGLGPEFLRTVGLVGIATGQTLFVLLYVTFPWYRTFLGRALFSKAAILAVLIDLGLFARTHPNMTNWDSVFGVLYILLAVGVWFQFFAFLRVKVEGERATNDRADREYDREYEHRDRDREPEQQR